LREFLNYIIQKPSFHEKNIQIEKSKIIFFHNNKMIKLELNIDEVQKKII